ncbi:hypothetical protein ISF_01566 [Cordyceps fumosorosea ARSEF 2679]|uniref:LPXTG-domain-containing protein n=1 Tax=Cordyceps fumosorosea (strain ARSEF 2679) TaxID=1081104 RepID=A0A168DE18_CORFA|nr:hypothetical protein ISF_01566 [Cordyceps fumosorosea ARSEF 2679]OAA72493.1 hypothetical protein ISF_01566 [Cordyceps fumosorosea ARSEF 2679]
MHRVYTVAAALFLVFSPSAVDALQVTPGSKCAKACLNSGSDNPWKKSDSNTNITDVTCADSSYLNTEIGQHYQRCLTCLQRSNRAWDGESDLKWFVYNLRYTLDACLFSIPSQPKYEGNISCATNSGCRGLKPSLSNDKLEPDPSLAWDYCAADDGNFMGDNISVCRDCLRNSNEQAYMANFITALEAGCRQTPNDGDVLGLSATVFSKSTVDIIDPQRVTNPDEPSGKLPAPAIAGIVVGVVLVCMIAVCLLVAHCRRERRYGSWSDPYDSDEPYHHNQQQHNLQSPYRSPNTWTAAGGPKGTTAPPALIVRPYHGEEAYMGARSHSEKTTPVTGPRFTAASRGPGGPGGPGGIELGGGHPYEDDTQGYRPRSQSTIVTPVPTYVDGEESDGARRGRTPSPRREQRHDQDEEDYFSHRSARGGERKSLQPPPPIATFGLPANPRRRSNTPDSFAEQAYIAAAEESERIAARHAARASQQLSPGAAFTVPGASADGAAKRFPTISPSAIAAKLKLSSLFRSSSSQQPIMHISAPILETSPRYSIAPRGPVVVGPRRQKRVISRPRQQAVSSDVYG